MHHSLSESGSSAASGQVHHVLAHDRAPLLHAADVIIVSRKVLALRIAQLMLSWHCFRAWRATAGCSPPIRHSFTYQVYVHQRIPMSTRLAKMDGCRRRLACLLRECTTSNCSVGPRSYHVLRRSWYIRRRSRLVIGVAAGYTPRSSF